MNSNLQDRRQTLLRELDRVNRQILETRKSMAQVQQKIAMVQTSQAKAA
jgi:prefoldin subunit 5